MTNRFERRGTGRPSTRALRARLRTNGGPGQRGQALTEYALLVAFGLGVLFTPVFPDPSGSGNTSFFLLSVKVFDIYINSFHTVITLPVP